MCARALPSSSRCSWMRTWAWNTRTTCSSFAPRRLWGACVCACAGCAAAAIRPWPPFPSVNTYHHILRLTIAPLPPHACEAPHLHTCRDSAAHIDALPLINTPSSPSQACSTSPRQIFGFFIACPLPPLGFTCLPHHFNTNLTTKPPRHAAACV